jgi:hypothetical protein
VHKRKDRKVLTREEAKKLFSQHSDVKKVMTEELFVEAMKHAAELVFDYEWDEINGTQYDGETPEVKFELLLGYMNCDNPAIFRKRMKAFQVPFNTRQEKNWRFPNNQPPANYKFQ